MSALKNLELHYFTIVKGSTTMGRGENVRLLLEDSGLDFKYVRHSAAQWVEKKKELIAQGIHAPSMPFITVDGKYYGKSIPSMRFVSKKIGQYEGQDDDENQLLDAYADTILDWCAKWGAAVFSGNEEAVKKHQTEALPKNHTIWNDILSDNTSGPYILGNRISYVDFALYHMLEDDNAVSINAETHPHLVAFNKAIESRPNLSKYLASERK